MFNKFQFDFRVSRITNNFNDPKVMRIEITDKGNGTIVFIGNMTLEQFALSIFGLSGDGDGEISDSLIGKIHEHKEVFIVTNEFQPSDERIQELLAPYQVDGWTPRVSDMSNHHRFRKNGFMVLFTRYV